MTHTIRLKYESKNSNGESSSSNGNDQNLNESVRASEASPIYTFSSPPTSRLVRRQGSLENEESCGGVSGQGQGDLYEVEFSPVSKKKITSSEYYAKKEKDFANELSEVKGFIIKEMKSDGACMFRAVADQVYGDQEMHKVVRENCMEYMIKNDEFFSKFITEDFDTYIKRKRHDRTYGDHVEIQALSEIYNRPIEVYQYSVEPINTFISYYQNSDGSPPLRLSYHGHIHYNSIVDPNNPNVGVGLGLAGYKTETETENELIKNVARTDVEEAIIEDKLKVTDWVATDEHLAHITAWQSYIEWMHAKKAGPSSSGSTSKHMDASDDGPSTSFSRVKSTSRSPPPPQRVQHKTGYSISGSSLSNDKPGVISEEQEEDIFAPQSKSEDILTGREDWVLIPAENEGRSFSESDFMVGYQDGEDDDHDLAFALAQSHQEYLDSLK